MPSSKAAMWLARALLVAAAVSLRRPVLPATAPKGRIAFAACRGGNWDIYSVDVEGDLRRLTSHPAQDRDPAWSPDGRKIAFASRRDGNWDIYVLDAEGNIARLTDDLAYDGAPSWSPDGGKIAFESYRAGDLDIFVMNADGTGQVNLTPDEPAGDYGPAWSPDGRKIAFTSWRYGDKDIFVLDLTTGEVVQLTESPADEESPVWSPDGRELAFVSEEGGLREVYVVDVLVGARPRRVTWLTRDDSPAWSPDGERLAFVCHRPDGEMILVAEPDAVGELPLRLTGVEAISGPLSWSGAAGAWGEVPGGEEVAPPYEERLSPLRGCDHPYSFQRLRGAFLRVPGGGTDLTKLSDRVDDSFAALQARVRRETGRDFLGELSEAFRSIEFHSEVSEYASWHKAGRAIDLLFDFRSPSGWPLWEVVREDMGGETYWRLFLRCARQDGSQGTPLKATPWDLSYRARAIVAPEEGGTFKPIPQGYYVDFTALAREYGWKRIAAHDTEEFSWKWHFMALEYWHYQKTDGLSWYQAMREVYSPAELERFFSWDRMVALGEDEWLIAAKGVPLPPKAGKWLDLRP